MGATEEVAAVLWVDMYVGYHYPCTTEQYRYCCNGAMRTMLFYFIVQGKATTNTVVGMQQKVFVFNSRQKNQFAFAMMIS